PYDRRIERMKLSGLHVALLSAFAMSGMGVSMPLGPITSYPAYLGGPQHASYAKQATTLTPTNAATAHSIWTWTATAKDTTSTYLTSSPIPNAGIIYLGAETGDFYAINAGTGATKWRKKLPINNCSNAGIVSSATVAKDPVNGKL